MERDVVDGCVEFTMDEHVGVSTNRAREMCIDVRSETIMSEGVFADAAGAEVFCWQHASGSHDSHERVEVRILRVL